MNIENELPPDFDVLKEAEIPTDEDERLEMPTQKKYSVMRAFYLQKKNQYINIIFKFR